jgi:hypothetical protein
MTNVGVQSQLTLIAWAVFFRGFRVTVKVAGKGFTGTGEMNFQLLDGKSLFSAFWKRRPTSDSVQVCFDTWLLHPATKDETACFAVLVGGK